MKQERHSLERGIDHATTRVLGAFELIVLLGVIDAQPAAYGIRIQEEVDKRRRREEGTSLGAIYTTLDRLEAKELVRSWRGEPTAARGGRSKRFFALTPLGE